MSKKIKPGREVSKVGFAGSLFGILFGIFWTVMAFVITAEAPFPFVHILFPLFGVIFVGMGVYQAWFNYKNATSDEGYTLLEIVDSEEEQETNPYRTESAGASSYCPYCGTSLESSYIFCPKCGKTVKK